MVGKEKTQRPANSGRNGLWGGLLCDYLLWATVGFLASLGVAALPSIGLYVLAASLAVFGISIFVTRGRGLAGTLTGGGIVGLIISWLNRGGTGIVCHKTADSTECGSGLNPVPFAIIGVLAVLFGIGLEVLGAVCSKRKRTY